DNHYFFFSSRRRHTRWPRDWSSDVCSSDLGRGAFLLTTEERGSGTRPAVLFALDAKTGKLLYQSGDSMKSWVHFSGLAVAEGHVFTVDYSSRVYCFGLRGEQR